MADNFISNDINKVLKILPHNYANKSWILSKLNETFTLTIKWNLAPATTPSTGRIEHGIYWHRSNQLHLFTTAPGFHSLLGLFFQDVKPFHIKIALTQFTIDYSGVYTVNFTWKILKSLDHNVRKYFLTYIYIY